MTEPNNCILRPESEKDRDRSEFVTREAFWNVYRPGCSEHYILHRFRDLSDFVPDLNYVLEVMQSITPVSFKKISEYTYTVE